MTAPAWLSGILLTAIAAACVLAFIRLLIGKSLPDRVVALDLISTAGVATAGVYAIATGKTVYLDVAIVIAVITFVGTVAFATYLTRALSAGKRDQ